MTDSPNRQAAPLSRHTQALQSLHEKLQAAELTEAKLLTWLKARQAIPPGVFALRSIPTRRLQILLEQWENILPQLR